MNKILMISAALGLAFPAAALATPTVQAHSVAIDHSDLNLASPRGQQRLTRRIESAARRVCGYYSRANASIVENGDARRCYKKAKAAALVRFAAVVEQRARGG